MTTTKQSNPRGPRRVYVSWVVPRGEVDIELLAKALLEHLRNQQKAAQKDKDEAA